MTIDLTALRELDAIREDPSRGGVLLNEAVRQIDEARADAEHLANALDMACDFLGMPIRSERNAAFVAQRALEQHVRAVAGQRNRTAASGEGHGA